MTATEWTGLAGTYLPIYVGLHTVIFLLVHRFLAKRTSLQIQTWPADAWYSPLRERCHYFCCTSLLTRYGA